MLVWMISSPFLQRNRTPYPVLYETCRIHVVTTGMLSWWYVCNDMLFLAIIRPEVIRDQTSRTLICSLAVHQFDQPVLLRRSMPYRPSSSGRFRHDRWLIRRHLNPVSHYNQRVFICLTTIKGCLSLVKSETEQLVMTPKTGMMRTSRFNFHDSAPMQAVRTLKTCWNAQGSSSALTISRTEQYIIGFRLYPSVAPNPEVQTS